MQKELGTAGAVIGMAALCCLLGGLALAIYPGWAAIGTWLNRADAPAWVQAVGSIGAIAATGWSVHYAHILAERQRVRAAEAEYTRLLEAIFQLVGGVHQVAAKISAVVEAASDGYIPVVDIKKMQRELSALNDALNQFDVTKLDRFSFIEVVLVTRSLVPPLLRSVEQAIGWENIDGNTTGDQLDDQAKETCAVLKPRGKVLLDAIEARGGVVIRDQLPAAM